MAKTWFSFTGTNPTLETDYTLVGSQPTCPGTDNICAIFADPDLSGTKPVITLALRNDMILALNASTDTTNVLLKA
jgi:hypothetical protein